MPKVNKPKVPAPRRRRQKPAMTEGFSDAEAEDLFEPNRRVASYCAAQEFNHAEIRTLLTPRCAFITPINAEVLHLQLRGWPPDADAFLFSSFGAVCIWSLPNQTLENKFMELLQDVCDEEVLLDHVDYDSFDYTRHGGSLLSTNYANGAPGRVCRLCRAIESRQNRERAKERDKR